MQPLRASGIFPIAGRHGGIPLLLALLTSVASAAPITQTRAFQLNSNVSTNVLHFDPFDVGLGTLQNVEVFYSATRRHDWALWNTDLTAPTRDVHYDASLTGTTLALGGTSLAVADAHYGPDEILGLGSVSAFNAALEFIVGRSQFLAGGTPIFPSGFHPASGFSVLNGQLSLPTFDGDLVFSLDPGSLNVAYFDGIWTLNAANVVTGSLVDISGTATVVYTYNAASVPDSEVGLVAIFGSVGLMVLALRQNKTDQSAHNLRLSDKSRRV